MPLNVKVSVLIGNLWGVQVMNNPQVFWLSDGLEKIKVINFGKIQTVTVSDSSGLLSHKVYL